MAAPGGFATAASPHVWSPSRAPGARNCCLGVVGGEGVEGMVTLDTLDPEEHCLVPGHAPPHPPVPSGHQAQERTETCPRPPIEPLPLSIRSPQGSAPLTCAQAEACAPQLATAQGPMVPEGELRTGLAQVSRPEAIIDHGVIERGVEAASHHPCPLAAGPAIIRQHRAVGEVG